MCPRGKGMTRPVGFMEFSLFERVIGEISRFSPKIRAKPLELYHFGESLLHPEIVRMVELAVRSGLQPVLSVNAPELSPPLAERLLRTGLPRLVLSLDGNDAASFARIRGARADFAVAVGNIRAAGEIRARVGSRTSIVVRMIRMRENTGQEQDFLATWRNRGFEAEVRDFFPWTEPDLTDLGEFERLPPGMPCPFPWQYLVVQWNGDVVPCCRDLNAENRLGSVLETPLLEIWNGPAYRDFRRCMADGDNLSKLCRRCLSVYQADQS